MEKKERKKEKALTEQKKNLGKQAQVTKPKMKGKLEQHTHLSIHPYELFKGALQYEKGDDHKRRKEKQLQIQSVIRRPFV